MECVSVVNLDTGVMTDITGPECIPEGLQGKNKLFNISSIAAPTMIPLHNTSLIEDNQAHMLVYQGGQLCKSCIN